MPGDQPAARPVQQPADIDGELLRLRPRQQHAVVERVQEPRSPIQRFSSTRMRCITRDLPGRPAEAESSAIRAQTRSRLGEAVGYGRRGVAVIALSASACRPVVGFVGRVAAQR